MRQTSSEKNRTTDASVASFKTDVKLCFVGDQHVGKTAIILSLSETDDLEQMRGPSDSDIEVASQKLLRRKSLQSPDIVSRNYKLPFSTTSIRAQFWDQANNTNLFPKVVQSQAQGIILVIDVSNRESFDRVAEWNKRIISDFKPQIVKVLVANKMDLSQQRTFEPVEAHKLAKDLGFIGYYEVSAIENINVNKPIEDLLQQVYFLCNFSNDA